MVASALSASVMDVLMLEGESGGSVNAGGPWWGLESCAPSEGQRMG